MSTYFSKYFNYFSHTAKLNISGRFNVTLEGIL